MESFPFVRMAFINRFGYRLSNWASPTAICVLPSQAILVARRADNFWRVLIHSRVVVDLLCVVLLGLHEAAANRDGVQFVLPNVPVKDLSATSFRIEMPLPALLDDRNRCRPILIADRKDRTIRVMRVCVDVAFSAPPAQERRRAIACPARRLPRRQNPCLPAKRSPVKQSHHHS